MYKNTEIKNRLTSIIILTYNKLEYTKMCIESIRKFTNKNSYEIIVVDNNSQDDTVNWLNQQSDLKVIFNKENLGFPKGCNQGIEIAKGDSILLLNNDVIVTPNWLSNLNKALYSSNNIGAVGAVSNSCSYYQKIDVNYKNIDEMIEFAHKYNISNEEKWHYRTKLIGFCMLIKREVLNKVGLLDEIFTPGNFEDDDLSFRIVASGYKLLLCNDVFIHHFGSVSFGEKANEFNKLLKVNEKKFLDKWGFNSTYSNFIRFDLINEINEENKNKGINVLEIGCGTGATLLEIKSRYKNANIYGIEIDKNSSKIAKNNCDLITGNVEEMELPYKKDFFDYIILGDVLEHLINPWKLLNKLNKYLKTKGSIISSIPNLMHISVLGELINGSFTYQESGILDKTHLRFFTLKEIQKMFINTGYDINAIKTICLNITSEQENLINKLCEIYGDNLREQYKVYQYVIKVNKKKEKVNNIDNIKKIEEYKSKLTLV